MTTTLIALPLVAALVVWLLPLPGRLAGSLALLVALAEVVLWVVAAAQFDFQQGLQLRDQHAWFEDLGVSYDVGFYGFSLWLAGLTLVVSTAAIGYALWANRERGRAYHGLLLFLMGAIVGVFTAQDLLVFYVFFEAMLIPLYVLIGVWGGPRRLRATATFVIYTMAGSLLMLASIVAFGLSQGTFSLVDSGTSSNEWVFLGFLAAFAVKAPIFPFHGWLVDAYRESPPEVAAILSGVVSKAAVYGLLRIVIAKFPEPVEDFQVAILAFASVSLVYGSLLAFRAPDIRSVTAYSSMAQMGLITLGLFSLTELGVNGAILQSVAHGLVSASLFLLAGMVEVRTGTSAFSGLGGMARGRPVLATVLMTTGIIALAVPGSVAFAGEFLILAGVYAEGWGWAVVGAGAIVLAAMYMLRLDLGRAAPRPRHRRAGAGTRPADERTRSRRAARGAAALPLRLAGADLGALVPVDPRRCDRRKRMIATPKVDWLALAPTLSLLAASGVALLGSVLVPWWMRRGFTAFAAFAGFITAGVFAGILFDQSADGRTLIAESFTRDRLGAFAAVLIGGAGALTVLLSWGERRRDHAGEYYALLAAAGAGMAFFVTAGNLMTLFLGLEWFSIALYILCALDTHRETSLEAGLKYLIVGAFGSAILLFGSALVYGATGELGFSEIAAVDVSDDYLLVAGLAMLIAGLGFKASAAPFHMWTPDVYEGAPTSITAFMSAATKVAALVLTLRILVVGFPEQEDLWTIAIAVIAVVSLAVGNLGALVQQSLKRLLAYSSVSHAGFMLIAIAANSELGTTALLYYLVPYGAMSIGAFAVVAARERELDVPVTLENLGGMGWERPFLGAAMWVFMLGFMGMPLTGGLIGKFYVFSAAYESGLWWLVIAGVIATAISLYYYLGVVRALYMRPALELRPVVAGGSPPRDPLLVSTVFASLVVTIGSFFFVEPLIDLAREASAGLPF